MVGITAALIERSKGGMKVYRRNADSFFSFASTLTLFSVLLGFKWVLLMYSLYYMFMCKKMALYYQLTEENRMIVAKLKGLEKVFYPHILWLLPQVQTVAYFVRHIPPNKYVEVEIEQDDGGSFFIDIYEPESPPAHTVVLVHGLGGSSLSKHVTILGAHFLKENYRVVAMGARGTKHPLKTPRFFHIGWTKDLLATFKYVLGHYDGSVSGVGFSLGGHWMTKLFGELDSHFTAAETARIKGGMAISIPFDFVMLSEYMMKPIPRRIYNRGFVFKIRNFVAKNRQVFEQHGFEVAKILRATTMHEIDLLLTSKAFGIENLPEYYYRESCIRVIPSINKPFLILNSKDDPIVPQYTIPIRECTKSTHVILALTERGGHMGFLGYSNYMTYAEEAAIEYIKVISEELPVQ